MSKTISKDDANNISWNPYLGIILAVVIFFGAQILAGILLTIYPAIRGWSSSEAQSWVTNSFIAQFIFVLISDVTIVGLIVLFLKHHKTSIKKIGLRKPKWTDPLFGLLALPVFEIIYIIIVDITSSLIPKLNISQKQNVGFSNPQGATELIVTFVSLVILPPIAEEILFRGFLYKNFKKLLPIYPAAILTSLIFAIGHLPEGGAAGPLYIAALETFVLSLVLIYLREKTNGLYASMTLHGLNNLVAFSVIYLIH